MGVSPGLPWRDDTGGAIQIDCVGPKRHCAYDFNAGQAHKAEVTVGVEVAVGAEEFVELRPSFVERTDTKDWKGGHE